MKNRKTSHTHTPQSRLTCEIRIISMCECSWTPMGAQETATFISGVFQALLTHFAPKAPLRHSHLCPPPLLPRRLRRHRRRHQNCTLSTFAIWKGFMIPMKDRVLMKSHFRNYALEPKVMEGAYQLSPTSIKQILMYYSTLKMKKRLFRPKYAKIHAL
jgi:hypothetical protein